MPDQLQLRGGTTTEHNSFTGIAREVTVDTTKKTVVVHDGSTAGGTPLMKESGGNSASTVAIGSGGTTALSIDGSQDITFTGASANAVWDKSDDSLEFADNAKATFGNASDLSVYHNGSHSYIKDTGTGDLFICSDDLHIGNAANTKDMAVFKEDAQVELYYDNSKKLETFSWGVQNYGNVAFRDSDKATFGASEDLQIYHDGTNNVFDHIDGSSTRFMHGNEKMLVMTPDSHVELYYDGSGTPKLETTSYGFTSSGYSSIGDGTWAYLTGDSNKSAWGNNQDLQIYHNGSHNYIESTNGNIYLWGGGALLRAVSDGQVELYYDGVKQCETNSGGMNWADGKRAYFGNSSDLQIYHDGSHSYIQDAGTGELRFTSNAYKFYNAAFSETILEAFEDGAVNLYWGGTSPGKKLETTSAGITVTGAVTETSDIALKTNIKPIDNVLDKIKQITGYTYQFKDTGHDSIGVTAQDVEKVFPELVHGEEGGKTLQYSGLIGALIESVKELSAKVAALESA